MKQLLLSVLVSLFALSACAMNDTREEALPEPRSGNVTDVAAFKGFLEAFRPTPEELRQVYPDLHIVLPGDIATKEYRMDNSRFFAVLDDDGRIIDGRFQ